MDEGGGVSGGGAVAASFGFAEHVPGAAVVVDAVPWASRRVPNDDPGERRDLLAVDDQLG